MPTPSADWQASISGLLMGAGTPYEFGPAGITGFGVPKAKTLDTPLDNAPGAYPSPDFPDVRVLIVPLEINQIDAATAWPYFELAKTAWAEVVADIQFHVRLPGLGHVYYNGRPRDLSEDLTDLKSGRIVCIGTFIALDPTQHAA